MESEIMEVDLCDSDSEDSDIGDPSTARRGERRKKLQKSAEALLQASLLSTLKEKKCLRPTSPTSIKEQDKITSELIEMLKVVPLPRPREEVPPVDLKTCDNPTMAPVRIVRDLVRKGVRQAHATFIANEVDEMSMNGSDKVDGNETPDKYKGWISESIKNLPESFRREPYIYTNIPKQVFSNALDSMYMNAYETSHLKLVSLQTGTGVDKWWTVVDLTKSRKIALLRKRKEAILKLASQSKSLDEDSIWGLKPFRYQLTAPYLKTSDGLSAAPPHPGMGIWRLQLEHVPVDYSGGQNWMAKDVSALKDSIREVLLERKLFRVRVNAELQLKKCVQTKEDELEGKMMQNMKERIEEEASPAYSEATQTQGGQPRRSGRKKKVFATINPVLCTLPNGSIVSYQTNNAAIEEWRDRNEDGIRKLKYNVLVEELRDKIDWEAVSNKVNLKTRKNRTALDCFLAFKHEADPAINCKRWTQQETTKLHGVVKALGIHELAKIVGAVKTRTEFQCFQTWKNTVGKIHLIKWDKDKDKQLRGLVSSTAGNWKKVAFKFEDDRVTKNRVMDRFKKNSNPILKTGQFSRLEDALLILTIEKLKAHFNREGHFGELISYLPWRFETVWRDRAGNLFANFIVPWTIEEDKSLLRLAEEMGRDWRRISQTFQSFKNRKGCLTRFKILNKRLLECGSVEAYHESYSMTRYNIFQYRHLGVILDLLKKINALPRIPPVQISLAKPPTDDKLVLILLSYDRKILKSTIEALQKYIDERNCHWKDVLEKVKGKQKTFDRRTFHREQAQSMASAIHIRGLDLIPKYTIDFQLTDYHEEVYKYYAGFTRTKALKRDAKRLYIPTAHELSQMPEVKDIVEPVEVLGGEDVHSSRRITRRKSKRVVKKRKIEVASDSEESGPSESELVSDNDD